MAAKSTEPKNPHVDLIGQVIDGRYAIKERLGGDGIIELYRAEQLSLDRTVAIKILLVENGAMMSERFLREARLLSKLDHPGVVHVIEAGVYQSFPYLARDFVEGRSLERVIHEAGKMSIEATLPLLVQICDALDHAHQQGVIHRDLTPDKIIVGKDGRPRIMDFGFARMLGVDNPGPAPLMSPLTSPGVLVGTPEYASPEIALGKPVDRRTDLYSLGVIAYRMISGKLPYTGTTNAQVLASMKAKKAPMLIEAANLPKDAARFCAIIDRLIELDPIQRSSSASWVAHALRVASGEQSLPEATEDATLIAEEARGARPVPPDTCGRDRTRPPDSLREARRTAQAQEEKEEKTDVGPEIVAEAALPPPGASHDTIIDMPPPPAAQKRAAPVVKTAAMRPPASAPPPPLPGIDPPSEPVSLPHEPQVSLSGIDMSVVKSPAQRAWDESSKALVKAVRSLSTARYPQLAFARLKAAIEALRPKVLAFKGKADPAVERVARAIGAGAERINTEWAPTFEPFLARVRAHPVTVKAGTRFRSLPRSARWGGSVFVVLLLLAALYGLSSTKKPAAPIVAPVQPSAAEVLASARADIDAHNYNQAIEALEPLAVSAEGYGDPSLHAALARAYAGAGRGEDALQQFALAVNKDPAALSNGDITALVTLLARPKKEAEKALGLLREIGAPAINVLRLESEDKSLSKEDRRRAKEALNALQPPKPGKKGTTKGSAQTAAPKSRAS